MSNLFTTHVEPPLEPHSPTEPLNPTEPPLTSPRSEKAPRHRTVLRPSVLNMDPTPMTPADGTAVEVRQPRPPQTAAPSRPSIRSCSHDFETQRKIAMTWRDRGSAEGGVRLKADKANGTGAAAPTKSSMKRMERPDRQLQAREEETVVLTSPRDPTARFLSPPVLTDRHARGKQTGGRPTTTSPRARLALASIAAVAQNWFFGTGQQQRANPQ
jgi:hypothetical protein